MAKLKLSVAVGDYDRTRALIGGAVAIDGVDPVYMTLVPEEIFFRAIRAAEFDICELSLSSYTMKTAQGNSPYIAVPAFLSRTFRHNAVYVRTDRVQKPADLKGRKVGVPEYQVTANVWVRAFLEDDYGVKPADIHWIRGGIEEPGRPEKLTLKLPAGVRLDDAPAGATISALLEAGEIDGFIAPRPPKLAAHGPSRISAGSSPIRSRWRRIISSAPDFFRSCTSSAFAASSPSAILGFPARCSKRSCRRRHWRCKGSPIRRRASVTLPFVEETLKDARAAMGEDFWSYGVEPNRKVLDYFLGQHHAQGLSSRRVSVDELFHPATYETFKV